MSVRLTIMAAVATVLTSVGLYPLFETAGWFGAGLGAVLVVGLCGLLTRRLRLPAVVCLAAAPVALLIYLTALFAHARALLGVVPTPASLATLAGLIRDGSHDANTYAAPVPGLPGIELLSVMGIGLIAVLVDFLAVRLRRAAPAGLPLLAMYSVPAAVRQENVSWLIFLLGAAGYLALLVSDGRERLSGWGRPVLTRHWSAQTIRDRLDSRPLAVAGRRIGLTAVGVAIVIPLAVPGIRPRGLFGIGSGGGGGATVITPDPLVSLKRQLVRSDDAVVLTYRTSDDVVPEYLRMYSLDRFDGDGWTYSPMHGDENARVAGRTLPQPPGLDTAPVRPATTRISVDPHVRGMNVLPAPYPPTKVQIKGDWRVDTPSLMIFSLRDWAGGRTYTVSSLRVTPTYQQLETTDPVPAEIASRYLAVPGALPRDVIALAHRLTATASTPYDRAVKLQQWFTKPGNFTYSLDVPSPRNVGALHEFLFGSRTGYCEQFAASMALLARIIGIPARVGMGYTPGTRRPDGTWVVRTKDTHAWPELYFTGIGWLRFEPTPAGGTGQGSATVPDYTSPQLVPGSPVDGSQSRLPTPGVTSRGGSATVPRSTAHRRDDPLGGGGPAGTVPRPKQGGFPVGWLLVVPALLTLLAVPAGLRYLARLRRWTRLMPGAGAARAATPMPARRPAGVRHRTRPPSDVEAAHAAWEELGAEALDFGLPWRPGDSPRTAARRLTEKRPLDDAATAALGRLVRAEERARYAPSPGPAAGLREDLRVIRAAIAARASRRDRWRARLLPPSSTATLRRAGGRTLDLFDRLDSLTSRRSPG